MKKDPKKPFLIFEGQEFSYEYVDGKANQVAAWAKNRRGIKPKEVVGLYMENRPEYFWIWMGLLKIGAIVALLNHNVKGKPLVHCLKVAKTNLVIIGEEVKEAVVEQDQVLRDELGLELVCAGGEQEGWDQFETQLAMHSPAPISRSERRDIDFQDDALLVYTSGTTGLPKAATIKHARLYTMASVFWKMFKIRPSDRVYCVLPLYHSAGGLVGIGMTFMAGATMVLRRRFSASTFFEDCRRDDVTVVQYIGELCRYLLQQPRRPDDQDNKIRIAIGNGLRPDIWDEFQDRFNIPEVGEFYGSTEGTAALFNHCTTHEARGKCGHSGWILTNMFLHLGVVKFDVETDEPVRGPDGLCVPCRVDETGELLAKIDDSDPMRRFAGYHGNKEATNEKILRDVYKKGDAWFRSGDLLKHDAKGYWHFIDRIGDTFRWKGENVSTNEVAEVVGSFPGVEECNVYGVAIPGKDGRACAAAIVARPDLDYAGLAKHCSANLPSYSIPLFIRLLPQLEITGTFKHQKVRLRKEGVDPSIVTDPLLMYDPRKETYVKMGREDWEIILRGDSKL